MGCEIIGERRSNSAHFHRPWRLRDQSRVSQRNKLFIELCGALRALRNADHLLHLKLGIDRRIPAWRRGLVNFDSACGSRSVYEHCDRLHCHRE
jgi:hypothetical protein